MSTSPWFGGLEVGRVDSWARRFSARTHADIPGLFGIGAPRAGSQRHAATWASRTGDNATVMVFSAGPAALVTIAILTLVGFALTRFSPSLRNASLPLRLGFALPLGVVTTSGLLYALSHLGVLQIRRTTILGVAAVVVAASLLPRLAALRPRRRRWRRRAVTVVFFIPAALVGLLLLGEALARPITDWDGRETWAPLGRMVRASRSADVPALKEAGWWFPTRHYPVALPITQNIPLELFSSDDERTFRPIYAALFLSGIAVLFEGMARLAGRRVAAVVSGIVAFVPHLTFWNHGGPSGAFSDYPLAVFLGAGLVLCIVHPRHPGTRALGGLLLAGVALTKVEGLPLAIAAAAAIGVVDAWSSFRGASLRAFAAGILPVFLLVGASLFLLRSWREPLARDAYERFVPQMESKSIATRLRAAMPVVYRESIRTDRWGLLWPSAAIALAIGNSGLRNRKAGGLALVALSIIGGAAAAYAAASGPAELARVTWGRFLVLGHLPLLLLLGQSLRGIHRRRPMVMAGLALATIAPAFVPWSESARYFAKVTWLGRFDDAAAANARLYGAAYMAGIDEIQRRLPPESAYLLVKATNATQVQNFVRYHLAPRMHCFLGTLVDGERTFIQRAPSLLPAAVVLVADPGLPPRLEDTASFAAREPEFFGSEIDETIPAYIDAPVEGQVIGLELRISGWCQEPPSRPCSDVSFTFDGQAIAPTSFERFARNDVQAAIAGMGSCARAGFTGTWTLPEIMAGREIEIRGLIHSEDRSRYRVLLRSVHVEPIGR